MTYSTDYRQMILDRLEEGYSYRELSEEHQISTTTIQRWKVQPEPKAYVLPFIRLIVRSSKRTLKLTRMLIKLSEQGGLIVTKEPLVEP